MNAARPDKHPNAPRGASVGQDWPSYRYSPDGEARVFHSAQDVPEGWEDNPNKFKSEVIEERKQRAATLEQKAAALAKWEADLQERAAALLKVAEPQAAPTRPAQIEPKPKPKFPRPALKLKANTQSATVQPAAPPPEPMVVLGDEDDEYESD